MQWLPKLFGIVIVAREDMVTPAIIRSGWFFASALAHMFLSLVPKIQLQLLILIILLYTMSN